ncbi:hypothetical protein LR48_Vigan10g266500 [Vigna angularis]|nr:hypothetical protein LR48_Vigan10g266500 [Vigna angularis]
MMYPLRRVWFSVATRFRFRKNGLLKLRHDVRACEYEDIQVMWEMLNRNESNKNNTNNKKKGQFWKLLNWARCAPYYYMCRRG